MDDGQVVVIFYDQLEPVRRVLEEHGNLPASATGEARRQPEALGVRDAATSFGNPWELLGTM